MIFKEKILNKDKLNKGQRKLFYVFSNFENSLKCNVNISCDD